jgi:predicted ATP-grasp superfamily ATP-dependent carboligase
MKPLKYGSMKMNSKPHTKFIVIFSGFNQRAVVAFLRTLEMRKIDNYFILASCDSDPILNTTYQHKVFKIRKNKNLDKIELIKLINEAKKHYNSGSMLIAPTTEALNRFLLKYREELENNGWIIPLVDKSTYETISDKRLFWNLCQNKKLLVPQTFPCFQKFEHPYVAKPNNYQSTTSGIIYSPILVHNKKEHSNFINTYPKTDFTFYEYVKGRSYYLLFYFGKFGNIKKFSQENLAQQFEGKSIIAAISSTIHKENICTQYETLFKEINYHGFVMVELRKNHTGYYMIEANPRFWGPSQLLINCNTAFFEEFLYDYGFLKKCYQKELNGSYFWSGGLKGRTLDETSCVFYGNGLSYIKSRIEDFKKNDIYSKSDTIHIYESEKNN